MQAVGPYRLQERLGSGGMGEVWRALDTDHDDRPVALKLLHPTESAGAEFTERFRREARLAAAVRHPNIVPIHRYGEADGRLFLAMQLVDGTSLSELLRERGPLGPDRAVHVVTQVADALDAAHAAGLVHRDVKPGNVHIVEPRDFAYLLDFGIARSADETGLTREGAGPGTGAYMAPERFTPGPVDPRMDVYSLGALLHACLVGRAPFDTPDMARAAWAHMYEPPPRASASDPTLPAALDDVVARAMAKDPDERHPTAGALATDAARALAGTGPRGPGRGSRDDETTVPPPTTAHTVTGPQPPDPRRHGPPPGPFTAAPASRAPRRRGVLIGAVAGVLVLAIGGVVAAAVLTGGDPPAPAAPVVSPRPVPASPAPLAAGTNVRLPLGANPFDVTVSPDGRFVYAVSQSESAVAVVDATTDRQVATIPTTRSPEQIAVSPDGTTLWVTGDVGVQALDTTTRSVRATVPIAGIPSAIAISPDGGRVYVGVARGGDVVELDTATLAVRRTVPTGAPDTAFVAVSPDGRTLVAISIRDPALTAFDVTTGIQRGRLPLPGLDPRRPVVTSDNRSVVVPDTRDGGRGLVVVDLTRLAIRTVAPTDGFPTDDVVLSPDGTTAYAHADRSRGEGTLFAVDTATWQVRSRTPVPAENSTLVAVSPDGSRAYVVDAAGEALVITALR